MRDKWTKSRDEAAKKDEENIVVKALLKQKEVALQQALEVTCSYVYGAEQGLSFDLEPTDKVPKNQNWLFWNME